MGLHIVEFLEKLKTVAGATGNLKNLIESTNNLYRAKNITPAQLKQLFMNLADIFRHEGFIEMVKNSPELSEVVSKMIKNGLSPNSLSKFFDDLSNNNIFFKQGGILDIIGKAGDILSITSDIITVGVTAFGNWQRHRELLSMMLVIVEAIPETERSKIENYEHLKGAIEYLLEEYDADFLDRLNEGLSKLFGQSIVWTSMVALAVVCPGAAAAVGLVELVANLSGVNQKAAEVRMRQFYVLLQGAMFDEFSALYRDGDTFSSFYSYADTMVQMLLNMAIYTNDLAVNGKNYKENEKEVYKANIEKIKTNFKDYLD